MPLLINAYSTLVNLPKLEFTYTQLNQYAADAPELIDHLQSFINFVMSSANQQMNAKRYGLYRHIQRVKHHLNFIIEESELPNAMLWAQKANAILFCPDSTIRDPNYCVLQYPNGESDPESRIPYPEDAIKRRHHTKQQLTTLGLTIPDSLPPCLGGDELILRSAQEVAERDLALMITAVQAEYLQDGNALPAQEYAERCPIGFSALSPKEDQFIHNPQPQEQDIINMLWRYEALVVLHWALNWQPSLPNANEICNVSAVVQEAMKQSEQSIPFVTLRARSDILDMLDLYYCLHWFARDCQLNGKEIPNTIDSGIILERHYALNWLVCFENNDWDDVDTPT